VDSYVLAYDVETRARTRLPGISGFDDVSANGEVFVYADDSLLKIYDRESGNTTSVDVAEFGPFLQHSSPRISGDGQVVAVTIGPPDGDFGIFLYDRATEQFQRATTQPRTLSPSLSNDGRFLAYERSPGEYGRNTEIHVLDRASGESALVSVNSDGEPASGWSFEPSISRDGRFVVFRSSATDLLAPSSSPPKQEGAEVYLHDRETGATSLLSTAAGSGEPSGTVDWTVAWSKRSHAISNDGQFVVYESNAGNIVPIEGPASAPDNNVYRYDAETGRTIRVNINSLGEPTNGRSEYPSISDDGRFITFVTDSTNLDPDDVDYDDAYLHDVRSGETSWVSRR
jgi:Tol biopolymer transport system component